jgi:integral membrane sensor domain MASE1
VSWGQVWKRTSGFTWPIVFGAILAAAPLPIGSFALGLLITPDITRFTHMTSTLVLGLAEAILLVVSVGYLSFAYQWFFEPTGHR